ncbi:alpha/beta fold hydrolase [Georgenia ruanii]|uniref:alpha/beta hydrolase n=1 Tax=Georgenia ruanii TaxID=348442 RepID=UPI001264D4C9|nr:alpha/beta hydrolase [Georgenia ruanii]
MRIFDGDAGKVAIIFPGSGYTPDRPLLHFARMIVRDDGWSGRDVWWPELPPDGTDALGTMVRDIAWRELHSDAGATHRLVIGKSLGSLIAPLAADMRVPGIWLTPLMRNADVLAGLARQEAPSLLIGGTADPLWDGDAARRTGHQVLEIEGANHSLEFPGDARRSVAALANVVAAMSDFVAGLDGS